MVYLKFTYPQLIKNVMFDTLILMVTEKTLKYQQKQKQKYEFKYLL